MTSSSELLATQAFMNKYKPFEIILGGGDCELDTLFADEFVLGSFDDARLFSEKRGGSDWNVWTITYSDENECLFALAGRHEANVVGFIVTEEPWESGAEEAYWFDIEDYVADCA